MFKKVLILMMVATMLIASVGFAQTERTDDDFNQGYMTHEGTYVLEGDIDWKTHAGTAMTGAEHKQRILGTGTVIKTHAIAMEPTNIMISDSIEWETHANALQNLMVLSMMKLTDSDAANAVYSTNPQMFAIRIIPNAGEQGYLTQSLEANWGTRVVKSFDDDGRHIPADDINVAVPNSFYVDYDAAVTDGEFRRFIDVIGEYSDTRFFDDLDVKGMASVKETFDMADQILPFATGATWWDLF